MTFVRMRVCQEQIKFYQDKIHEYVNIILELQEELKWIDKATRDSSQSLEVSD